LRRLLVTLPIQPANSILSLKTTLSSQQSTPLTGSTPDQLRLLLKGKALLDAKLVKDYDIKDGSTITVMSTSSSKPAAAPAPEDTSATSASMDLNKADRDPVPPAGSPSLNPTVPRAGHQRRVSDIPAVTLSPAGTPMATTPLLQPTTLSTESLSHVPLVPASPQLKSGSIPIDLASIPLPISASQDDSPYHQTMANPQFWKEFRVFLEQKFGKDAGGRPGDGEVAFEEFLRGAKANLSAHEIARIRDAVGITGMGGN
jgi:ubiquitin-like protein 4